MFKYAFICMFLSIDVKSISSLSQFINLSYSYDSARLKTNDANVPFTFSDSARFEPAVVFLDNNGMCPSWYKLLHNIFTILNSPYAYAFVELPIQYVTEEQISHIQSQSTSVLCNTVYSYPLLSHIGLDSTVVNRNVVFNDIIVLLPSFHSTSFVSLLLSRVEWRSLIDDIYTLSYSTYLSSLEFDDPTLHQELDVFSQHSRYHLIEVLNVINSHRWIDIVINNIHTFSVLSTNRLSQLDIDNIMVRDKCNNIWYEVDTTSVLQLLNTYRVSTTASRTRILTAAERLNPILCHIGVCINPQDVEFITSGEDSVVAYTSGYVANYFLLTELRNDWQNRLVFMQDSICSIYSFSFDNINTHSKVNNEIIRYVGNRLPTPSRLLAIMLSSEYVLNSISICTIIDTLYVENTPNDTLAYHSRRYRGGIIDYLLPSIAGRYVVGSEISSAHIIESGVFVGTFILASVLGRVAALPAVRAAMFRGINKVDDLVMIVRGGGAVDDAIRITTVADDVVRTTPFIDDVARSTSFVDDVARTTSMTDDVARSTSFVDDVARTTSMTDDVARSTSFVDDVARITSMTDDVTRPVSVSDDLIYAVNQRNRLESLIQKGILSTDEIDDYIDELTRLGYTGEVRGVGWFAQRPDGSIRFFNLQERQAYRSYCTTRLHSNMNAAGVTASSGDELHHIVPVLDNVSDDFSICREYIARYGIDANSVCNGIYLPRELHTSLRAPGVSQRYGQLLSRSLSGCNSQEEVIETLIDFGQMLRNGTISF